MLYSIVTVTYNAASLLEKTIESVLDQSFPDLEYIIIDGGSSDGTQEIINNHSHRLKYWVSEKDSGIYNAMNKAIQQCSGEWVIFMNAGDTFSSDNILACIQPLCTDDTDIIYGDRFRTSTTGERVLQKAGRLEDSFLREVVFHQSCFIRTNLLKERPYDESYKLAADYEFILHSINECRSFRYVNIPISNFLDGGISSQSYLLSHVEAIRASISHSKNEFHIHRNFFFNALILRHLLDVLEYHVEDSKSSSPDFGVGFIKTVRGVSIYADNITPALAQILNQISRALSLAPSLLSPGNEDVTPFTSPAPWQEIIDQEALRTATDNIELVQVMLSQKSQVDFYKEENEILLRQLHLAQQQILLLKAKAGSVRKQKNLSYAASKVKVLLRKYLSERNVLRLHRSKVALLKILSKIVAAKK